MNSVTFFLNMFYIKLLYQRYIIYRELDLAINTNILSFSTVGMCRLLILDVINVVCSVSVLSDSYCWLWFQGGSGPLSSWTFTSRHQVRGETWLHTEPVPVPLLSPKNCESPTDSSPCSPSSSYLEHRGRSTQYSTLDTRYVLYSVILSRDA